MILIIYDEYPFFIKTIVTKEVLHGVFPNILTDIQKKDLKSICNEVMFINNYADSIKETLYELCNKHKYTKIIAPRETDLLLAAELREKYGIKGQTLKSAMCFRDKVLMKSILEKSNIRVPKFKLIKNRRDIDDYLTKTKNTYPVVIKPTLMSGSRNVSIIKSYNEILEWLIKYDFGSIDWEIEEYISGDFFHVDGLVQNGNIISIWPSKYVTPCADISYDKLDCSYIIPHDHFLMRPLCLFAEKVIKELQLYSQYKLSSAFHMELFYSNNKEIVFCEVASRVGGCRIHENWSRAFNIDLYEQHINMSMDYEITVEQPIQPKLLVGTLRIPTKLGTIIRIPRVLCDDVKGIDGYICYKSTGRIDDFKTVDGFLVNLVFSFVTGKDENELLANLNNFKKWFYDNTLIL
ncbi:unnamed protein product [Rotaria sp. Silwood2]|nr:unnamed protein product [Rotaria sp. Silwood2]CAF4267110.1 unnamed protein product [Rotaria sp. Silwood2]